MVLLRLLLHIMSVRIITWAMLIRQILVHQHQLQKHTMEPIKTLRQTIMFQVIISRGTIQNKQCLRMYSIWVHLMEGCVQVYNSDQCK